MNGTAADMNIEENLALAARRGKQRFLGWGITAKEREEYKERLGSLGLGLEDRMTSKVGLLSRRTASGSHTFNGIPQKTEAVTFR